MRSRHDSNLTYIFSQNSGLFDLQILLCSRTPYILERLTGEADLHKVALRLNQRQRKILGFEISASKRKCCLDQLTPPGCSATSKMFPKIRALLELLSAGLGDHPDLSRLQHPQEATSAPYLQGVSLSELICTGTYRNVTVSVLFSAHCSFRLFSHPSHFATARAHIFPTRFDSAPVGECVRDGSHRLMSGSCPQATKENRNWSSSIGN